MKIIKKIKPGVFGKMLLTVGLAAAVPLIAVILITRQQSRKDMLQSIFKSCRF
jgi:hypothetical protein